MRRSIFITGLSGVLALAAALGPASTAQAARGGNASHAASSLGLVLVDSTDGVAHHGQRVTFDVATAATDEPHVSLLCSQAGAVVYSNQTGYYADYPWPWTQTMTLSSNSWTAGEADCTAKLYYFDAKRTITAATLSFHVEA